MEKYAYHILIPAIIIWFPLFIAYIFYSIGTAFYLMEIIGKFGQKLCGKVFNRIELYMRYRTKLKETYLRIAMILTYILFGIMIALKIFG